MEAFLVRLSARLSSAEAGAFARIRCDGALEFVSANGETTSRIVPACELVQLAASVADCSTDAQLDALATTAAHAYGGGATAEPSWTEASPRLMPQLWPTAKIAAKQATLPSGVVVLSCGLHGETEHAYDVCVVLVVDYSTTNGESNPWSVEQVVLSRDVQRWGPLEHSFTTALRVAMENLRERTRTLEAAPTYGGARWEHHESGCGASAWRDRYDCARCALLPSIVAKRKRPDGGREPGAHVAVFAARNCALATTAKNALGLCYAGDVVCSQIAKSGDTLSTRPYRLVKVKTTADASRHPLVQKAGEGVVWRWVTFTPQRSAGECGVPRCQAEVDATLAALEQIGRGEPGVELPVFADRDDLTARVAAAERAKQTGNGKFAKSDWRGAVASYNEAVAVLEAGAGASDAACKRLLAVSHSNASQALLNEASASSSAAANNDRADVVKNACAAEALRHAMRAVSVDSLYAKAHLRCSAAFEVLGEAEASREAKLLYERQHAIDAAAIAEQRTVQRREREQALAARAARAAEKAEKAAKSAKLEEARTERRKQDASEHQPSLALPTTITLDDGLALSDLGMTFSPPNKSAQDAPFLSASPFVPGAKGIF